LLSFNLKECGRLKDRDLSTFSLNITNIMVFNFTQSQSTCIASVDVNGQEVSISFQSNPEKVYSFFTENELAIVNYLQNPSGSIGKMYRNWVAENVLIPADQLAAV
jgi:hypothetical protein